MSPRIKKLIGLVIMLPAIFAYMLFAAALADYIPDFWLAKLIYFMIAGVAWAYPMIHLMKWMNAEPNTVPNKDN